MKRLVPVVGALFFLTIGCGSTALEEHATQSSATTTGPATTGDFVSTDPSYTGQITRRTGTNDEGAAYSYAGEHDRSYTQDSDFDTDVAELTAGLPPITGAYRIYSTHANADGANLFANPEAIGAGDIVIYNACNTAAGTWATEQARAVGVAVYATDGKVAGGRSSGQWYKIMPDGTRTTELPPGTSYAGSTEAAAPGLVPHE